jgi:hypothetical protein
VSESIYILRSQPELKGKIVPIIGKWLRIPTSLLRRHTTYITNSLLFLRAWGAKAYKTFWRSSNANLGVLKMT